MKAVAKILVVIMCAVFGWMLFTGAQGVQMSQAYMPTGVGGLSYALTMGIAIVMLVIDALVVLYITLFW